MNKPLQTLSESLYQNKKIIMRNTLLFLFGSLIFMLPNIANANNSDAFMYINEDAELIVSSEDVCNDVTDGGSIEGNQSGCANPNFDPSTLTNVTLPSGGSSTEPIEYIWMYTTDDPNGQSAIWKTIPGTNAPDYDPGFISETTYFTRCARRIGCPIYVAETNWVCIEINCDLPNIGDTVFNDLNGNGIQDPGEPGVGGVKVKLFSAGADGAFCTPDDVMETMQITNASGMYLFMDVQPGSYYIEFCEDTLPDGFSFTSQNQGGNDDNDSDADPDTGKTNVFTVNYGDDDDLSYDGGIVADCNVTFSFSTTNPTCDGANDGTATVNTISGTAPFTYSWSEDFGTGQTATGIGGGSVCVTVTDANGCTDTDCVSLYEPDPFEISGNVSDASCGEANGSISITGAIASVIWSNGATTNTINNLAAGEYCATATGYNGCISSKCFNVGTTGNITFTFGSHDASCTDEADGSAFVNVLTGTAPYTYSWSNGATEGGVLDVLPGEYCVTITDAVGCQAIDCITIGSPSPVSVAGTTTDASCGESNGSINITASGGTAPYSYDWGTNGTSEDLANLTAGDYCVTVTDVRGCHNTACFNVGNGGELSFEVDVNTPACLYSTNSTPVSIINLTGTAPYTYNWPNGTPNNASQTLFVNGTFTVTVEDANGCSTSRTFTVDAPNPFQLSPSTTNASCGMNNGEIRAVTFGGTSPYSYLWADGAVGGTRTDLAAGTYCVTVTDANGCTRESCQTVRSLGGVNFQVIATDARCSDSNDGVAIVAFSGMNNGPYTIDWSDDLIAGTDGAVRDLAPGDYCVTVTDVFGCVGNECFTISAPQAITVNATVTDASCGENNGRIDFGAIGGTGILSYDWGTGQFGPFIGNLAAGTYCITVTDERNCTHEECFNVNNGEDITLNLSPTNPTCYDSNNGAVAATTSGGTAPINVVWSTGAMGNSVSGLGAGEICATATDAAGCTTTECITLVAPTPLDPSIHIADATCGENNGTAILGGIGGGTSPYTYSWSNGETTVGVDNLPAGEICGTLIDGNGCTATVCATIGAGSNLGVDLERVNTTCPESNDGIIYASPIGGTAPYTYSWLSGETTSSITGLTSGEYCVTLTDANGCTASGCNTVLSPFPISLTTTITDATCGASNGSISIDAVGGAEPYLYLWTGGRNGATINNLAAGNYCVTATDASGCVVVDCYYVNGGSDITLSLTPTNPTCFFGSDGSVTASTTGGTPPVSIVWSNGAMGNTASGLSDGEICATATDANGCTMTQCVTLVEPELINIDYTKVEATCNQSNGSITVTPTNGVAPYTYLWENGSTNATRSNLAPNANSDYCVVVTDANGCTQGECFDIEDISSDLDLGVTIYSSICDLPNGSIEARGINGEGPYSYIWNTGATTAALNNLLGGSEYCVTLTDNAGCTVSECWTLVNIPDFTLTLDSDDPTCFDALDGSVTAVTNGGFGPFTYNWSNDASTSIVSNLNGGEICVTVTDTDSDCVQTACVTLTEPSQLGLEINFTDPSCDFDDGVATVTPTGGTAPYSYNWNPGTSNTNTLTGLAGAQYCVTVTDANGCEESSCIDSYKPVTPDFSINGMNSVCPEEEVLLSTANPNPTETFTYAWSSTGGTLSSLTGAFSTFSANLAGTYTITVIATSLDGCTATETFEVTVKTPAECGMPEKINIGNYVWFDIDEDGIQDPFEQGVEGVKVKLFSAGTDGLFCTDDDVMEMMQVTNSQGYYLFECVEPGEYYIEFCIDSLPVDTELTSQNTGGDDDKDSDADPTTGKTDPFTVVEGQDDDLSFDAGIIIDDGMEPCDNFLSGGEICCDQVLCGAGSVADPITSVSAPTGGSGTIEYLWMMTTNPGPFDPNTWTVIPGATDVSYAPGAIFQTTYFARCARREGCTGYLEANIITIEIKDAPRATIENLPSNACIDEDISFNAKDGGVGATYAWDFGAGADPATYNGRNANGISWSSEGEKTITLTVTRLGCTKMVSETIQINDCTGSRFVQFNATEIEGGNAFLEWETKEEMNDHIFMIEHAKDGENFEIIDSMEGKDSSLGTKKYTFEDRESSPGRNYYKIRHIDLNSGTSESTEDEMIMIIEDNILSYIVYPNPTPNTVTFESLKKIDEEGTISVVDALGQVLEIITIPVQTETITVDLSKHQAGTYYFFIKYDSVKLRTKKIIKTRD